MKRFFLLTFVLGLAALLLALVPNQELTAQANDDKLSPLVPVTSPAMTRVAAGLAWLADHQSDGGYWNPEYFHADSLRLDAGAKVLGNSGGAFSPADQSLQRARIALGGGNVAAAESITAVALLAFLRTGNTLQDGPYAENVRRSVAWLTSRQDADGCLSKRAVPGYLNSEVWTYNHAFSLWALSEAEVATPQPFLAEAIDDAASFARTIVNTEAKGWGYSPKASRIDITLTSLMAMALAKASKAGSAAALKDKFEKTLDEWLLAQEGPAERNFLVSAGNAQSQIIPTNWPNQPLPTLCSVLARVELGTLSPTAARARAQAKLIYDTADSALSEPIFMGLGMAVTRRINDLESLPWFTSLFKNLRETQRGYRADEIGKFAGAGSADGRKSLDEHGSWDPSGQWSNLGGRPFATAMNVLAMLACADWKHENTDLSDFSSKAGSKLIPWEGEKAGLPGREPEDLMRDFWVTLIKPLRDMKIDATRSHYVGKDGAIVADQQMYISNAYYTEDLESMERSDKGEPVIEFTMVGARKEVRYFLPMLGQEWALHPDSKVFQDIHGEALKTSKTGDARGLNGPNDPRFPWHEIVWEWYFAVDVTTFNWAQRCGAAHWFNTYYGSYPWADENDQGHAVWNGFAEEILLDAERYGEATIEYAKYIAAYQRQQPELLRPNVYFYLDTFLTPDQMKVREGLQGNADCFLSWYDAYYAARRSKQVDSVKKIPAVKALRDECREDRAPKIIEARNRLLLR